MVVGSVVEEDSHFTPLIRIDDATEVKSPVLLLSPLALVDTSGKMVDVSFSALLLVSRPECFSYFPPLPVPVVLREF